MQISIVLAPRTHIRNGAMADIHVGRSMAKQHAKISQYEDSGQKTIATTFMEVDASHLSKWCQNARKADVVEPRRRLNIETLNM